MIDEELEADIDMAWRYDMELCLARAPPKYVHPPGTTFNFFHLRVNPGFWQKFFKTPCVPNGCIYRSAVLGREQQVPEVSFDAILGQKIFENFTPKS